MEPLRHGPLDFCGEGCCAELGHQTIPASFLHGCKGLADYECRFSGQSFALHKQTINPIGAPEKSMLSTSNPRFGFIFWARGFQRFDMDPFDRTACKRVDEIYIKRFMVAFRGQG